MREKKNGLIMMLMVNAILKWWEGGEIKFGLNRKMGGRIGNGDTWLFDREFLWVWGNFIEEGSNKEIEKAWILKQDTTILARLKWWIF